jgi:two-component system chemotaxis sensor kinase CheA
MSTPLQPIIEELVGKIAMELVFAEPGKDAGLLPINSLLSEIEDACNASPPPDEVRQAVGLARGWVDAMLDTGAFTIDHLKRFNLWMTWMQDTAVALKQGRPVPPMPAWLSTSVGDGPEGSKVSPPVAQPAPVASQRSTAQPAPPPATMDVNEEPLVLNMEGNADLIREFLDESHEHLQQIELAVLALEENPDDKDNLNSIFRAFHTLKGGSGFLNLTPINKLAHELESLLDLARQGRLAAYGDLIDLILAGADVLKQFVAQIEERMASQNTTDPILLPTRDLVSRVRAAVDGKPSATTTRPAPSSTGGAGAAAPAASGETVAAVSDVHRSVVGFVKVDTIKLDNLIDLVGELVIAQSLVNQDDHVRSIQSQQLARNLAHLNRILNDLQRNAMSLRMVPIRSTFQKMHRLVRDLANKADKQVELRMSGDETELDRNIIEEINDPLVHMIRNSVDHGIERPESRVARGKPSKGTVQLRAFHQGGSVVIEIEDDGNGLDKDRILAKARAQGLVTEGQELTEKEIFDLIFAPGFSTAEKVTDISGRGVGMDVVRRNIDKLRGKIEIRSIPGKGSVFSIFLPLTLAIIDGLIVSVGGERFILPTLSVRESFRPHPGMISTLHERGEMVNVRGKLSPLLRLHEHFDIKPETTDPTQSIVIVVESNAEQRCLMVDRLLGKQEVVIKGLGDTFKQSRTLAGAAILGDGRVGLILDVNALVRLGGSNHARN